MPSDSDANLNEIQQQEKEKRRKETSLSSSSSSDPNEASSSRKSRKRQKRSKKRQHRHRSSSSSRSRSHSPSHGIRAMLKETVDSLKNTVQQQLQAAGYPASKAPINQREKLEFDKKPISLQAKPLTDILEKVDAATELLGDELREIAAILQEIVSIAEKRLLELQIADTHGWETVRHFSKGKIGKTAAQQKAIRDAVAAAAAEKASVKPGTSSRVPATATYQSNMANRQPFQQGPPRARPNPTGNCFECGQPGHFASACPKRKERAESAAIKEEGK